MKEIHFLLSLQNVKGLGNTLVTRLLNNFGSAENIFKSNLKSLLKVPGINSKTAHEILNYNQFNQVVDEVDYMKLNNIEYFSYLDPKYPTYLKHCYDPPSCLFFKGNCDWENRPIISIVGTRKMTDYGQASVDLILEELKEYNPIIVSGLAYGVDIATHKKALELGLDTIGIVAHGLDIIYPKAHTAIAKKMELQGGIMSEYKRNTNPDRENFPTRNRIIAGISQATIVIEAASDGGALITANLANSYNREVFALPGKINEPFSKGCNALIRNNMAQLITSGKDIALFLGWEKQHNQSIQTNLFDNLSEEQSTILKIIQNNPAIEIDNLIIEAKMEQSVLAMILLELEMSNKIISLPGKKYRIK